MRPALPARQFNGTLRARHPESGGASRSESERYAQGAGEYRSAPGVNFIKGTVIKLEPAEPLYTALSGSLPAYVRGQDDRGGAALVTEGTCRARASTGGTRRPARRNRILDAVGRHLERVRPARKDRASGLASVMWLTFPTAAIV